MSVEPTREQVIPVTYVKLTPGNFPDAQHGEVVASGPIRIVSGGIPGEHDFDVQAVVPGDGKGVHYWSPAMLAGRSKATVRMNVTASHLPTGPETRSLVFEWR